MNILEYRRAGHVKRWHTKRTIRTQTVAEHTFGVICILNEIVPNARKELFQAALYHDLPELETGDIPAPAKWLNDELRLAIEHIEQRFLREYRLDISLSVEEMFLLMWADMMELVLWCLEELEMGNTCVMSTVRTGLTKLHEIDINNAKAKDLLRYADEEWEFKYERE